METVSENLATVITTLDNIGSESVKDPLVTMMLRDGNKVSYNPIYSGRTVRVCFVTLTYKNVRLGCTVAALGFFLTPTNESVKFHVAETNGFCPVYLSALGSNYKTYT